MGFTALWISPITAQVPNAYHGYYQTDLYSVNSEFGSADDLKNLVSAVHAKGMYLMLDIVPNHMAYPGCPDKVDYASFNVMGQPSHFHAFCPLQNMQNQTEVEHCWLGNCNMAMPDLKTDDEQVANELNYWVKQRVSRTTL
ncbi:glycoside hydrolase [Byssothecium circinans]|uniref:Glycoside hydrolase n=1 Tax=Byssothecium circinans TaxID=147558 RepID=A0A6A5TFB9_9PLEO|nr:glycoside hydrolase [Byssothecium circinans]